MSFDPKTMAQMDDEVERLKAEWPEGLPSRFSASATSMLWRCPEQYRRRYLQKEIKPPNPNLLWGKGDTQAVGAYLESVIIEQPITLGEVGEAFSQAVDDELAEHNGEVDWQGVQLRGAAAQKEIGKIKDAGIDLAQKYVRDVAPTIVPAAVEHEIEITSPMWPIPVVGYLDVVEGVVTMSDEGIQEVSPTRIIERKTSGRKPSGDLNAEWRMQGRIYQRALNVDMVWHVSVKSKKYEKEKQDAYGDELGLGIERNTLQIHRTEIMVAQAMKEVEHYYTTYGPDDMWPGRGQTHPWACGYCGYRDTCPWWAVI